MPDAQTIHEQTGWVEPLAHALKEAHDRYIAKQISSPQSRGSNWASSLGHPCDLHLTFWRTQGEKAQPVSTRLQRIFEEGKKQEDLILRELEMMGVRIVERGVPISSDSLMRELNIGGKLDARLDVSGLDKDLLDALTLACPGLDWRHLRPVAECKSLSPFLFDKLVDYDAIMTAKQHYVRSWGEQMQLYLVGKNREAGLYIFKNKTTGELRFVPVLLDLETCDVIAAKAKRINAAVEYYRNWKGDPDDVLRLPTPISWRQDLCAECPFLAICPNSREIPATDLLDDKELEEALDFIEANKGTEAALREAKELRDEKLERYEGKNLIVGTRWQVRWRKIDRKESITPAGSYYRKDVAKLPEPVPVAKEADDAQGHQGDWR